MKERDVTRFDVYGRLRLELELEEDGSWVVYRLGSDGKRGAAPDVPIPPGTDESDLALHLEALFHELARPGTEIRRIG